MDFAAFEGAQARPGTVDEVCARVIVVVGHSACDAGLRVAAWAGVLGHSGVVDGDGVSLFGRGLVQVARLAALVAVGR